MELIDFDKRVVDKKLLKLENGIADSFFQLSQTMPPGRYLIRAYTEWNRNFDDHFITEHYITIYAPKTILETDEVIRNIKLTETESNQFELSAKVYPRLINSKHRGKFMLHIDMGTESDSILIKKDRQEGYHFKYLLPKNTVKTKIVVKLDSLKLSNNNLDFLSSYSKTIVVNADYLDLQFFPEGGKLVNGLFSKVAFKAIDYQNRGRSISGTIVDQFDSVIVRLTTNKLGMGYTLLKADINKIYYGCLKNNKGIEFKYRLPKVHETGYVLRVNNTKNQLRLSVNSNKSKQNRLLLKVQCRGITYFSSQHQLDNGLVNVLLDRQLLPEGILKITVLDSNKNLLCERLFFNHKEDNKLEITTKTHLKNYSQREKTILKLTVKDKDEPVLNSNLSVLVFNKEQLGTMHQERQRILSYFLLNSELRGFIEKPGHYFDEKNKLRYRDLEALMLTQGWRNYLYKDVKESKVFKIKAEKALAVTGTIGEFFNSRKKPKKPIELTMMTFVKPQKVLTQKVDSSGQFKFHLGDVFTGELEYLIQSLDNNGKKKDYTINIDKNIAPKIQYEELERFNIADTTNVYISKNIERQQIEGAIELANGVIGLDEVKLSDYKLTPEREKIFDLHGLPDVVIEDKELHKKVKEWSYGLFSVLMFGYPNDINVRRDEENGGFLRAEAYGADFTFIIIDGIPVRIDDYDLIGNLPTEEIKSVEIIESPKNPRKYVNEVFGDPGALLGVKISFITIYTYSKKGLFGVQKTSGIFKSTISGFSPRLEFYAPKHEDINVYDWNIPDLRSVVHWSPSITTDLEGNAEIEYYNDDSIGDILIIVEGITPDGKIGYYEMTYTVDKI